MSTTLLAEGWDWAVYFDGCACGAPVECPKWIVGGTKSCEPYPCFCEQTRASAPDSVAEPKCWWRKRGTGKLASRCPCWGRKLDDTLPSDCCGRHEANPQYVNVHPDAVPGPAVAQTVDDRRLGEIGQREPEPRRATSMADGANMGEETPSYPMPERRWKPEEVTCVCPTPWDRQKTAGGYHCVACHTHFVNISTAMVHQRSILQPCRPPQSIVDIDTKRPLMYPRTVNGHLVWAFSW
jgi:hypothetical protein